MVKYSMYDCNSQPHTSLYDLMNKPQDNLSDLELKTPSGRAVVKKYMNWLRCLNVIRACHLLRLLNTADNVITVRWNNDPSMSFLTTTMFSLSYKPEFITERPCRIFCRFSGGPPGHTLEIISSLLNFIVDRVFHALLIHGAKKVDAWIIQALNYKEPLLLEGPVGA